MGIIPPTVAVRSPGSRKASIGLAELRAISMNRLLRQRPHARIVVGVIVIRETK